MILLAGGGLGLWLALRHPPPVPEPSSPPSAPPSKADDPWA
jgi:hypothetical protein